MTRTPQQTFWSDQALAAARETATDGRTLVVVNDFPDGEQCSWCDCTLADFKDHRCGGCQELAGSVLRVHDGSPVRRDVPVCEAHRDDAVVFIYQVHGVTR
ncbi:hypothetical protein PV735_31725 [Streptomyces turgidiscabies]|uniref:hypothetical protein n=1 Tax=Streptomyces turgidiscabies TaxID=85558 RepID=UPI0029AD7A31|nr:hypothetical protein [Streptomyces turgidiscabies]MDX3497222.1 hypothetical protein [Streptomyces turgidiscabies]